MKKYLGFLAMIAFMLFAASASTSAASPGHAPEEVVYNDVGLSPPLADVIVYQVTDVVIPLAEAPFYTVTQITFATPGTVNGSYENDVGIVAATMDLYYNDYKIKSWPMMLQSKHPPGTNTTSILKSQLATNDIRTPMTLACNPSLYPCDRTRYI